MFEGSFLFWKIEENDLFIVGPPPSPLPRALLRPLPPPLLPVTSENNPLLAVEAVDVIVTLFFRVKEEEGTDDAAVIVEVALTSFRLFQVFDLTNAFESDVAKAFALFVI